jgi:ribosomal protein L32
MLTRLLRRPLGLWRAQASLSLLDAFAPRPVLAGAGAPCDAAAAPADDDHHLWFAVPKSRISRSKKRTKAHGRLQNLKFKPRSDWRIDENTGRPVLRHRLLDSDLDATVERVREAKKRTEEEVTKEDN